MVDMVILIMFFYLFDFLTLGFIEKTKSEKRCDSCRHRSRLAEFGIPRIWTNFPSCEDIWTQVAKQEETFSHHYKDVRDVPFVSLAPEARMCGRFEFERGCVQTLGRKANLRKLCTAQYFHHQVFVWGSEGVGKSHLLNEFAFLKFAEHIQDPKKPRVLWIPNLWHFAANPFEELLDALLLAYLDSALKSYGVVGPQEFLFFLLCEWMKDENLILVADNFDALEHESTLPMTRRQQVREFVLFFCTRRQSVVFAGRGNQTTVDLTSMSQQGILIFPVVGDCKANWQLIFYAKYADLKEPTEQAEALALAISRDDEACAASKLTTLAHSLVSAAKQETVVAAKRLANAVQMSAEAKQLLDQAKVKSDSNFLFLCVVCVCVSVCLCVCVLLLYLNTF